MLEEADWEGGAEAEHEELSVIEEVEAEERLVGTVPGRLERRRETEARGLPPGVAAPEGREAGVANPTVPEGLSAKGPEV